MKLLCTNLDQALDKLKFKNKKSNFYDVEEKAKDQELDAVGFQIKEAQKTIKALKTQINSNPGVEK